ncbi:hypothetical protein SLS62_003372 [Diatrype stigma]|uniref:RNase H type-1 domain-containing protein n=1 Tax=Diatrype stigma TaxID=117547 RepID=A0AAN9V4Y6_9PEZI
MAKLFEPTLLNPLYEKPSDMEVAKGVWVHPKLTYGTHTASSGGTGEPVENELVAAIAARVDNSGGAIGAAYFGPTNWDWNVLFHLPSQASKPENALLQAVIESLEHTHTLRNAPEWTNGFYDLPINGARGSQLQRLVIKSDSRSLAEAATAAGVAALKQRGWKTSYGEDLDEAARQKVEWVLHMVELLRVSEIDVRCWRVEPEENREASALAAGNAYPLHSLAQPSRWV